MSDMSTALFETTGSHDARQEWPPCGERHMVRHVLRSAAERAQDVGSPIIASVTWAIPRHDLVHVFAAAREIASSSSFYWEQPTRSTAYVGIGAGATLTATGDTSIADIAAQWQSLLQDAVITTAPDVSSTAQTGPLCFGGFAFDPLAPRTSLWEDFPDGLLVLPELLISSSAADSTLTANLLVTPEDDTTALERRADALELRLLRLRADIERRQSEHCTDTAGPVMSMRDLLPASEWMSLVSNVTHCIQNGAYEKVVLARGIDVNAETPFDVSDALQRLRSKYPAASIFALQRDRNCFLGASPERLARVEDGQIRTMALAGTAPRGASDADDQEIAQVLLHSEKNQREHAIVVETVRNGIAPLVSSLDIPEMPTLLRLANVQHLQTTIAGTLIPNRTILDVVAALHPTPAVGGFPRDAALAVIREHEHLDRGWYAGPIGWVGPNGDGEFAVALRSAMVEDNHATLFAGCGIVAESEPEREYEESRLKLQVMLDGLCDESRGDLDDH